MIRDENMGAGILNPFPGQATEWVDYSAGSGDSDDPNHSDVRGFTQDPHQATAVTSRMRADQVAFNPFGSPGAEFHRPVLDIDLPVKVVPSSTPGHSHVFIDAPMTWATYSRLLEALADAGLVERGYVSASQARGYTSVRLPHVKRDVPREAEAFPASLPPSIPADLNDPTGTTVAPWYRALGGV